MQREHAGIKLNMKISDMEIPANSECTVSLSGQHDLTHRAMLSQRSRTFQKCYVNVIMPNVLPRTLSNYI